MPNSVQVHQAISVTDRAILRVHDRIRILLGLKCERRSFQKRVGLGGKWRRQHCGFDALGNWTMIWGKLTLKSQNITASYFRKKLSVAPLFAQGKKKRVSFEKKWAIWVFIASFESPYIIKRSIFFWMNVCLGNDRAPLVGFILKGGSCVFCYGWPHVGSS